MTMAEQYKMGFESSTFHADFPDLIEAILKKSFHEKTNLETDLKNVMRQKKHEESDQLMRRDDEIINLNLKISNLTEKIVKISEENKELCEQVKNLEIAGRKIILFVSV